VATVLGGNRTIALTPESTGYFSGFDAHASAGNFYQFQLDEASQLFPDPASRFQPMGPHGPSQIVDPSTFHWTDDNWPGVSIAGQVIYEMHIGTFTYEGTWNAARVHLPDLVDTGFTALEIMPVAAFPGKFGWGYDGVDLFAPTELYGTPDDFRAFVDRAHALGLAVILDVVYNHLGPDGNYLKEFSNSYFTERYKNEWGEAINFDGPDSGPVREFFISNARYWVDEFHLDGLRFDATQQIFDASTNHILKQIVPAARKAARSRKIIVIAENEPQRSEMAKPIEHGGLGFEALWNDDFHHTACVAMTGRREAYLTDYRGTPQEFISSLKWGYLYHGQYYSWQKKRRGTPTTSLKPESFINYIQNHDQIANSPGSRRIDRLTTSGLYRTITALLLLGPETPMLFQGQEFGASAPFSYFADHNAELALLVQKGREAFMKQFPSFAQSNAVLARPNDRQTFEASKLDHSERRMNNHVVSLHSDLIRLRRSDHVFGAQRSDWLHGAVLGPEAFALRFFGGVAGDRLIVVNLGDDLELTPVPEPLLAPPLGGKWGVLWYSESPCYGGCGRLPFDKEEIWFLAAQSAVVLSAGPGQDGGM
jgi:maltooligosyltrehalose trehalohydrolase